MPGAAPASIAKHVYIAQGASRTPCFRGNRNTLKSSIPWPRQSNCSASVFALWLATARRHVVIQRPMPSSEHSVSTETAALAQGRKTAIPLQRERKREREEEALVTEDEDAVGRGCCSRVCKEAKTSSGTDWARSKDAPSSAIRYNGFMNPPPTRGPALWGLSRCSGTTREVPLHCHRRWQISLLSAGSKSIVLRLVPCKVMLQLCAINMLSLWQFFSRTRVSHFCQQCCFASPLQVIKVLLSVCVYTQAPVSAVLAKVLWRSRNYCLLMCAYPGSDVVHRSADAAGQPLQDRADPSANYQSHPSWQQRRQRRYQERQWWRPEQLHTWRLESLKHICL